MGGEPEISAARPWSAATSFWARTEAPAPAAHFRTSAHAGDVLADALLRLLDEVDLRLGRPAVLDVVDVGAGGGELLAAMLRRAAPSVARRLRLVGVDLLPRPAALDPAISWVQGSAPDAVPSVVRGMLVAHEWLDELPVDVVEVDDDSAVRLVLVADTGVEALGPSLADDSACAAVGVDAARARGWLAQWWPVREPGERAEVGTSRDDAWAVLTERLGAGTVLAIDYAHTRDQRSRGRYAAGTLVGYLDGALVTPRPDGRVNVTAHVAADSCADGVPGTTVTTQRDALLGLGVSAALPPTSLARTDPTSYADALERASLAAELLDPVGLGGFVWLRLDR